MRYIVGKRELALALFQKNLDRVFDQHQNENAFPLGSEARPGSQSQGEHDRSRTTSGEQSGEQGELFRSSPARH